MRPLPCPKPCPSKDVRADKFVCCKLFPPRLLRAAGLPLATPCPLGFLLFPLVPRGHQTRRLNLGGKGFRQPLRPRVWLAMETEY